METHYDNCQSTDQPSLDTPGPLMPDAPRHLKARKPIYSPCYRNDLNTQMEENICGLLTMTEALAFQALDHSVLGLTQEIPPVINIQAKTNSLMNETTAFVEPRMVYHHRCAEKKDISTNRLKAQKSTSSSKLLHVLDTVLAFTCIGPLVSIYWYSTWTLSDYYIIKSNLEASYWTSFTLGCTAIAVATLLQDQLLAFSSSCSKPVRYILMRLFTYFMSVASVNQWRGVWGVEDFYTGISSFNAMLTYILTTAVLICLRGQRSVLCSPAIVYMDIVHADHYKLATFWTTPPGPSFKFVLDAISTAFLIEPLASSVWRGLWELVDCELYPDDVKMRIIVCIVGCYSIVFTLSVLQVPTQRLAAYLESVNWYLMLIFENLITALFVVFSIINWRGIWLVFEEYAPRKAEYMWLYHCLSFGILAAGLTANSAMTQVSPKDGSIPHGRGTTLELSYVTSILSAWRMKTDVRLQHCHRDSSLSC